MAIAMLSSSRILFTVVQVNHATVLVKSDSALPEDVTDAINHVCAQMIYIIIFIAVLGLTSGHFEANCLPYFSFTRWRTTLGSSSPIDYG
jgi:hypothetical protein